jgi:hypothetical protein
MSPKEAIELIRETNEPLAVILERLLHESERTARAQEGVIEALINHFLTLDGNVMDFSKVIEIISQAKRN